MPSREADVLNCAMYPAACTSPAVEQWLRGFMDARYVVVDSFHGCVFSILFNKPFIAIANSGRGETRFTSLLKTFGLSSRLIHGAEELNQAGRAIAKLGGRLLPPVDYEIPGCGVRHRVVRVEKLSPTPKGYPRRWAKIQKAPL